MVALGRLGLAALDRLVDVLHTDEDENVRAEAVEVMGALGDDAYDAVLAATADPSSRVVEAAIAALGEIGDPRPHSWLIEVALGDGEPLVREAAIACLGSIGDRRAVPALLDLVRSGRPQLRRRAVVALTAFDGPEVEAAFRAARLDRNPMVREAAEMVIGRPTASSLQPPATGHRPPTDRS